MAERMDFEDIIGVIKGRALEMVDGLRRTVPGADRDMQKRLFAVAEEIEKSWKQGKPVQRRSQTVLAPLTWQAYTGIEPEKLDIGSATDLLDLMQPGYTPQWSQLVDISANALIGAITMSRGQQLSQVQYLASIQLPLTVLYIYMAARRFGAPSVFELRDTLAEKLLLTDADKIRPDDVQPPLPGFYIQMPPGAMEMWNNVTGWHKVSFVGVAEGLAKEEIRAGRILYSVFWGEPNENSTSPSDDNAQTSFVSLPDGYDGSVEEHEKTIRDVRQKGENRQPFVRWNGTEFSFEEGHKLLRKFVINFCLYLSSPNPDIEPTGSRQTWKDVIDKAEGARKTGPHARRQVTIGKNFSLWDVGRRVNRIQRTMTATDVLVRGHWTRQAHGPRWSLRKVIWIEPFVRLRTGGEVEGHEYAVKGVKKNTRGQDVAREVARRIQPIVGEALGSEVANNAASAFAMMEDELDAVPLVVCVRDVLMQRKRYPGIYKAEHLTDEMIDQALTAVEGMEV